jgi:RNA polymerase sigma-70 factor (ECF subfamily)
VPLENIIPWARSREAGPEGEAITQEQRDEVQRLITQLPEKYRAPLVLRYFDELSCAEIAEVLGMPEGTVKTQIHRARKALGKLLAEGEEPQDALSRV